MFFWSSGEFPILHRVAVCFGLFNLPTHSTLRRGRGHSACFNWSPDSSVACGFCSGFCPLFDMITCLAMLHRVLARDTRVSVVCYVQNSRMLISSISMLWLVWYTVCKQIYISMRSPRWSLFPSHVFA